MVVKVDNDTARHRGYTLHRLSNKQWFIEDHRGIFSSMLQCVWYIDEMEDDDKKKKK